MTIARTTVRAFLLALGVLSTVHAQPAPMAQQSLDALAAARERVAVRDTAAAIAILRDAAMKDANNGVLWYEYGALLSAQTRFAWGRGSMPRGIPQVMIAAESSLARGMRLAPDSVNYAIAYARHLLGSNPSSIQRVMATQRSALQRAANDSVRLGMAADQLGIILWRQFEPLIGKSLPGEMELGTLFGTRQDVVEWIRRNYRQPTTMFGMAQYEEALSYARLARTADPSSERYFRHEMMMLAERQRWQEMESIARLRISQRRGQPWPWLVLGLTEHRRGRAVQAAAAFDSGFARLDPFEKVRLDATLAYLFPRGAARYDTLTDLRRDQIHTLFWNTANPSFMLPANMLRNEYRARVVYADIRFTDEEQGVYGANSDKGEIFIRYGPPEAVIRTPEGIDDAGSSQCLSSDLDTVSTGGLRLPVHSDCYSAVHLWVYVNERLWFKFGQNRGYGTSFQLQESRRMFDSTSFNRPSGWSNIPVARRGIDSLGVQVARFRGPGDSIDYAVFTNIRPGALRRETQLETSYFKYGVFLVDILGRELERIAAEFTSGEKDTTVVVTRHTVLRSTRPASSVRVEALEPDLLQVARSVIGLPAFTSTAFGTSELLLARTLEPPSGRPALRWSDYSIAPLVGGVLQRGEPLLLLWETYQPSAANGTSRLQITVRVERQMPTGFAAIAGRVVSGVREAVTGSRRDNGLGISYTREFAHTDVTTEHLGIELGELASGRYRITLLVTDAITGKVAEQTRNFVVK